MGDRRRPIGRDLTLAEQLREAIERSGMKVCELATEAEIDRAQVLRFIAGTRDIRLETAGYIARVLGLELTEISRGRGRPKQTKTERPGMSVRGLKADLIVIDEGLKTERPGDTDS